MSPHRTIERDKRDPVPVRIWGRTSNALESLGRTEGFARTTLIGDAAEILADWITCARCGKAVPAVMGDCTGGPLRAWVTGATLAVYRQKCDDHQPLLIGSGVTEGMDSPISALIEEVASLQRETETLKAEIGEQARAARETAKVRHELEQARRELKTEQAASRDAQIRELDAKGYDRNEIAERVGVTRERIRRILRQDAVPFAGAGTDSQPSSALGTPGQDATAEAGVQGRTEPPEAVFREPAAP